MSQPSAHPPYAVYFHPTARRLLAWVDLLPVPIIVQRSFSLSTTDKSYHTGRSRYGDGVGVKAGAHVLGDL